MVGRPLESFGLFGLRALWSSTDSPERSDASKERSYDVRIRKGREGGGANREGRGGVFPDSR